MQLHGQELQKLIRYIAIGGLAFITEFGVFYLLVHYLSSTLIMAQSLSFIAGLIISFTGSRYVTFAVASGEAYHHQAHAQLIAYAVLAVTNLLLTNIVIQYLVEGLSVPALIAKVVVMALVVSWNFIIFNKLIFRTGRN